MRFSANLIALVTILILTGCTVTNKTLCPCEAPEIIRLGKKEIEINAKVSLIDSANSGKMKIVIWITTLDHTALPSNFIADYYYLRSSDLVRDAVEGKFTRNTTDLAKGVMELETTNAPRWREGELVDVAVHLVDSRGKVYFLKKDKLPVQPVQP